MRQSPAGATTDADTLVYRVAFAEVVSNVSASDFTVSGTTATVTSVSSAGGNAYDVTVSGGDLASLEGAVEAYSAGPGLGSEFIAYLPLPDSANIRTATQPRSSRAISLSGLRIMIVGDNRDAAGTLGLLLQTDGADVQVVYDGRAALSALETFDPQVL